VREKSTKTLYYDNKVNYFLSPHEGVVPALVPDSDQDIPVTNVLYIDFLRTDLYTETGSRKCPFKTLSAAYNLAALTASDSNPKILTMGGTTNSKIDTDLRRTAISTTITHV
jgi:hypothetical protein